MANLLRVLPLLLGLLCSPMLASAQTTVNEMQEQLNTFKRNSDHLFAPQTTRRAEQYLGAAMLAAEQDKQVEVQAALARTAEKLAEAKHNAADFRKQHQHLLLLRRDAMKAVQTINSSSTTQELYDPAAQGYLNKANEAFTLALQTRERGDLNNTQAHASSAKKSYQQAMQASLPRLAELTESAVSKAASAGAKKYTPIIYQAAKDKLVELRTYVDGISGVLPTHPTEALELGREAKILAERVKTWRKHTGSHEKHVMKSRRFRLQLATELGITETENPLLSNVSERRVLLTIKRLQAEQAKERKQHKESIAALKAQHQQEIESRLLAQTDAFKETQQNQISGMKEAFRAKLERETFEKKRQNKILSMFNKNESNILINLDGSMLIRLGSLKFASSKSKIDTKYYDLLSRLKNALELYPERGIRIEGHTDNQGDVKPNQVLSLKRAEAVREYLIASGIEGTRLKALGYGEVRPIASNDFPQGRAMNRRIDIVINADK